MSDVVLVTCVKCLIVSFVCIVLVACGSDNPPQSNTAEGPPLVEPTPTVEPAPAVEPSPDVQEGRFIDSPVAGLRYSTETQSGVTDDAGTFHFIEGEKVTFHIGELMLGTSSAQAMVTPFDIVEDAKPLSGNSAISDALTVQESSPYQTVMNIALLLQALDYDRNPENGISISSDVSNLFSAQSVNIHQTIHLFENDFDLRNILSTANAQALFSEQASMPSMKSAIDHLYRSLGLTGASAEVSYIEDSNADGVADSQRTRLYDANGNETQVENMNTRSGLSSTIRYEYDENNNRTYEEADSNGVVDTIKYYRYDAFNRNTRYEEDAEADGSIDKVMTYEYDSNGFVTRYTSDSDGDGNSDQIVTYEYDSQGARIEDSYDNDGDGEYDQIITYSYDSDGNRLLSSIDDKADGSIDRIERSQYDANGNRTRFESDRDNDGDAEFTYLYQWNENNQQTVYSYDNNGDGILDYYRTNDYDDNGNRTGYKEDFNGDGVVDRVYSYQYDDNGNQTEYSYDQNADNISDAIYRYVYNTNQQLVRYEQDTNKIPMEMVKAITSLYLNTTS